MTNIEENSIPPQNKSPEFVKIPVNIPTHDKELLRALSVFFALKQYRYTGMVYDYVKNKKSIAANLGISPGKLTYTVKYLFNNDFLTYEGKHLKLISFKKLCSKLDIRERFERYQGQDVKAIEYCCYAIAVKQNLKKQNHAIQQKLVVWELEQIKTFRDKPELFSATEYALLQIRARQRSDKSIKKIARKFTNKYRNQLLKKHENAQEMIWRSSYGKFAPINPFVTLSCSGVARITMGSQNSSTGHYMQRKMAEYGFIDITGQYLTMVDTKKVNQSLRNYNLWENDNPTDRSAGLYGIKSGYRTCENLITIEF